MSRILCGLWATVYVLTAPLAAADPDSDPHVPNRAAHYCPGGFIPGYLRSDGLFVSDDCAGVPYSDGSFQLTTSTNPASLCVWGTIHRWVPVSGGDNDCSRATWSGGETVGR